jgi:hypothetical protein
MQKTITQQVEQAAALPEPQRNEAFEKVLTAIKDEKIKENVLLIRNRISTAGLPIDGFTKSEVEYYQNCFAKDFYFILHSENFAEYIEERINELTAFCKAHEVELRTCEEDHRQQIIAQHVEADRYKTYLQSVLSQLAKPVVTDVKSPSFPVIGLFCSLIQNAGADEKGGDSKEAYCKRICEKYNLPYADNVRQNYSEHWSPTKKYLKKIINEILPHIDAETKKKIDLYLNNKEKLYA